MIFAGSLHFGLCGTVCGTFVYAVQGPWAWGFRDIGCTDARETAATTRVEAAERALAQCIACDAKAAMGVVGLEHKALVALVAGNNAEAVDLFREALSLQPDSVSCATNLALSQVKAFCYDPQTLLAQGASAQTDSACRSDGGAITRGSRKRLAQNSNGQIH